MAAAGTKIGTGYVEISPDFSGFQEQVERAITTRFNRIGDQAGKKLGDGISRRMRSQRGEFGLASALAPLVKRFERTGQDAGRKLSEGVSRGAKSATRDMSGLAGAIAEVDKRSRAASKSLKGLDAMSDFFDSANRRNSRVGDALGLDAMTEFFTEAKKAPTKLSPLERASRRLRLHTRGLTTDLLGVGRALSRSVTSGARSATGGFGGMNGAMARVNRGAQFFRNITRLLRFPALVTGLGLATQGLAALAAGFTAAASAVGPLAGALVALPAAVATATQAFGALKLATAGIGDTIKAALDAQIKGGGQAADTLRQQQAATDRVADAERAYEDAQRQTKTTRDAVNSTLREARHDYRDLEAAAARSYLSEEEGALRVKELRQELDRVAGDADSSELDIRLAENSLSQAKLDLRELRTEAKRTRKDYADATRGGVENMPEVVAARQAHQDSIRGEKDAARDLERAVEDSTAAMGAQGAAATKLSEEMGQLPPAAQAFVRQIVSMKPKLDQLRATAASGLFPGVSQGLKGLMGNFGVVNGIVGRTTTAFGGLAAKAGEALGGDAWGRDLKLIGDQNVQSINQMGAAGGNLADTFRHILVAARPFVNWLGKGTVARSPAGSRPRPKPAASLGGSPRSSSGPKRQRSCSARSSRE